MKPQLYIAGPYSEGDTVHNIQNAVNIAGLARVRGWTPFIPHLFHLWHLIDPHHREYWMELDKEYLLRSDALYRLVGKSRGADEEVALAVARGIPVYYNSVPKV